MPVHGTQQTYIKITRNMDFSALDDGAYKNIRVINAVIDMDNHMLRSYKTGSSTNNDTTFSLVDGNSTVKNIVAGGTYGKAFIGQNYGTVSNVTAYSAELFYESKYADHDKYTLADCGTGTFIYKNAGKLDTGIYYSTPAYYSSFLEYTTGLFTNFDIMYVDRTVFVTYNGKQYPSIAYDNTDRGSSGCGYNAIVTHAAGIMTNINVDADADTIYVSDFMFMYDTVPTREYRDNMFVLIRNFVMQPMYVKILHTYSSIFSAYAGSNSALVLFDCKWPDMTFEPVQGYSYAAGTTRAAQPYSPDRISYTYMPNGLQGTVYGYDCDIQYTCSIASNNVAFNNYESAAYVNCNVIVNYKRAEDSWATGDLYTIDEFAELRKNNEYASLYSSIRSNTYISYIDYSNFSFNV